MKDFDKIGTLKPVDKVARIVTSESEEYHVYNDTICSTDIPNILEYPGYIKDNITKRVFGNLTVIGYAGSSQNGAKWVVKCRCGNYQILKGKLLRKGGFKVCHDCNLIHLNRTGELLNARTKRTFEKVVIEVKNLNPDLSDSYIMNRIVSILNREGIVTESTSRAAKDIEDKDFKNINVIITKSS